MFIGDRTQKALKSARFRFIFVCLLALVALVTTARILFRSSSSSTLSSSLSSFSSSSSSSSHPPRTPPPPPLAPPLTPTPPTTSPTTTPTPALTPPTPIPSPPLTTTTTPPLTRLPTPLTPPPHPTPPRPPPTRPPPPPPTPPSSPHKDVWTLADMKAPQLKVPLRQPRVFLAALMSNNEHIMKNFIYHINLLAKLLGPERLFISIYESGSTDLTPCMLKQFNSSLPLTVGRYIQLDGQKRNDHHRIDFLAELRNLAIQPLFELAAQGIRFDTVLFMNDVFFTVDDILRLLKHDVDLACASDFAEVEANQYYTEHGMSIGDPVFYDSWVTRTIEGYPLRNAPPFFWSDPGLKKHLEKHLGVTIFPSFMKEINSYEVKERTESPVRPPGVHRVTCCWNGIIAIRASTFYQGVRFRRSFPGECAHSECSLLCKDLWSLNFRDFVVDETARVAYASKVYETIVDMPKDAYDYRDREPIPSSDSFQAVCCGLETSKTIPEIPCIKESYRSLISNVCSVRTPRLIPLHVIQIGPPNGKTTFNKQSWMWKSLHPGHRYLFFEPEELFAFATDHYGTEMRVLLQQLHQRHLHNEFARLGRYLVMHELGGIYADVATFPLRSLSCLLTPSDTFVLSSSLVDAHLEDSLHCFAAMAKHPLLARLITETRLRLTTLLRDGQGNNNSTSDVTSVILSSFPSARVLPPKAFDAARPFSASDDYVAHYPHAESIWSPDASSRAAFDEWSSSVFRTATSN
eukprot:TRINITY_DN341_c0_g1_i4.p1 TRINITY_DN341_c0_g1~~TRINITY_DN341_c0_g1_i4.p1  ORF type:complete len:746 (+),score=152.83 TRINITY_DN341_c0_g1_i4:91-2328(+)